MEAMVREPVKLLHTQVARTAMLLGEGYQRKTVLHTERMVPRTGSRVPIVATMMMRMMMKVDGPHLLKKRKGPRRSL